jgi:hypothetical protein
LRGFIELFENGSAVWAEIALIVEYFMIGRMEKAAILAKSVKIVYREPPPPI